MFCIHCGAQIDDDSLFCTACGAPVEKAVADAVADDAPAWRPAQQSAQQPTQQYPIYAPAAPPQAPKKRSPLVIVLAIVLALVIVAAVLIALITFDVIPNPFARNEATTEQVAEPSGVAGGNGLGGSSAESQDTGAGLNGSDASTTNTYVGGPADYYYFEFPGYRSYDQSVASNIGWGIFTYGIPTGGFEVVEASKYNDGIGDTYHGRLYNADQAFSLAFDAGHNGATTLDDAYARARGNHSIDYEWTNGTDKYVVSYYSGEWEYYICGYVNGSYVVQMTCEYPAANEGTCNQWVESIYDSFKLL